MGISKIKKLEQAIVQVLNIDGWDLKIPEDNFSRYDAYGTTPKGKKCVIEMKFRNKHYEDKMLEKDKYDALMSLDDDIVKIYFVADTKGNFMYWLNTLKMPETVKKYCPDTTMWTKKRLLKDVYLLQEKDASIINLNKN
jgi:hypothetical protein|tara:strand:+ start:60 stop:476 length:417 start_codon:yes stop_codon:yes gene_type:complete